MRQLLSLLLTAGLVCVLGCTQPKPTSKLPAKGTAEGTPGVVGVHKNTAPEETKKAPEPEKKDTTPPAPEKKDSTPPAEKKEPPKK